MKKRKKKMGLFDARVETARQPLGPWKKSQKKHQQNFVILLHVRRKFIVEGENYKPEALNNIWKSSLTHTRSNPG
ncbi:Solute Carrier Family 13 Member 3 [Manis pentadactyla]|nr:Solute Carrier Family 13 Member 3 [Manis pentadactyla]